MGATSEKVIVHSLYDSIHVLLLSRGYCTKSKCVIIHSLFSGIFRVHHLPTPVQVFLKSPFLTGLGLFLWLFLWLFCGFLLKNN